MTIDQAYIDNARRKAHCRQFIAVTEDIPALCDEIERLWRENELLRRKARALELMAEAEHMSIDEAIEFAENHPLLRSRT